MKTKGGGAVARGILAMAGRRSPWKSGDDGGPEPEVGDQGPASEDAKPAASDPPTGDASKPKPDSGKDEGKGPRNPWLPAGDQQPRRSASLDEIFRTGRKGPTGGGGGSGGGFPRMPVRDDGKSWWPLIIGVVALAWIALTSTHMLGPKEQGIVTIFGKYSRTIGPGVSLTLPWPIESVEAADVTSINKFSIPDNQAEKLMLTSDKNLVDLSYLVRWSIKDLRLYKFRLEDPDKTVREVAEAAMRATVAEVPLNDVIGGAGRGRIEQNVRTRMQGILDAYKAGVLVQGVGLTKTDPPQKVVAAFQNVNVAQQQANRYQADAKGWAGQVMAIAQGEAAAFDKIYAQYKLAPAVTKRRLYYETMERVLRSNEKVVLESNGVTSYLPLPEVKRKPAIVPAPATTSGGQ
jgi:modulator of FtsH protease HflK